MSRIPRDFYKLFASKYTDYYMLFLAAIHEEMSLSYSVLGLTEKECRAVMNEKIASATLLWDEDNCDEEGIFLTRSNMAAVCLKHFEEWGWLRQDYDETLNSYVVTFPEYSQMYVELFRRLFDENDPRYQSAALDALACIAKKCPRFEINTGAISRGWRSAPYPAPFLLKQMHALGCRIVLSSDSHSAQTLCSGFPAAASLAAACGFTEADVWTDSSFSTIPLG